jgi:hypothetical protein
MHKEYDVIVLKKPIVTKNLSVGQKGTILLIYNDSRLPRAYEIEFLDDYGNTIAIETLTDEFIEAI